MTALCIQAGWLAVRISVVALMAAALAWWSARRAARSAVVVLAGAVGIFLALSAAAFCPAPEWCCWSPVADEPVREAIGSLGRPDVLLVDLRENSERAKHGTLSGALHAPYPSIDESLKRGGMLREVAAATGRRIVFFCAFGERSAMAVAAAKEAGLANTAHIAGGIDAWKKAGGPVLQS